MKRPKLQIAEIRFDFERQKERIGDHVVFFAPDGKLRASLIPKGQIFASDQIAVTVSGINSEFVMDKLQKFLTHIFRPQK